MRVIIFAILCFAVLGRRTLHEYQYKNMFRGWMVENNKNYTAMEAIEKYEVFQDNVDKINEHNAKNLGWTMAINQFADMTELEFAAYVKRGSGGGYLHMNNQEKKFAAPRKPTCSSADNVAAGKVASVKNQGQCGSCWSFSAAGAVEGLLGPNPTSLSEQQLVDCDKVDSACNGGLMDYAFQYIESNGLCSDADYSYQARKGFFCKSSSCNPVSGSKIGGFEDIRANDDDGLCAALCDQPVAVAIEADSSAFQFYSGGVMSGDCGTNLDHGVLATGFGTDAGQDYWTIKNSWGEGWGESGYIRICRNCNKNRGAGQCGILLSASYPTSG